MGSYREPQPPLSHVHFVSGEKSGSGGLESENLHAKRERAMEEVREREAVGNEREKSSKDHAREKCREKNLEPNLIEPKLDWNKFRVHIDN